MMLQKRRLINFRPIVTIGLFMIVSILISALSFVFNYTLPIMILSILTLILIVILVLSLIYKKYLYLLTLILSIIVIIVSAFSIFTSKYNYDVANYEGVKYFEGNIFEIKEFENNDDLYYYNVVAKGDVDGKIRKISLSVITEQKLYKGSNIIFTANIYKKNIKYKDELNLYSVINKEYFYANNVTNFYAYDKIDGYFNKLKGKLLDRLQEFMPNSYGFSYALLTGETSYIGGDSLNGFRYSGIAHIFAVSGLHVGFLFAFVILVLKLFKVRRKIKIPIAILIALLYLAFCGFTPSCMRAFIILSFASLGDIFDYKSDKLSAMFFSIIIVLSINSINLFDIGFLLSYLTYSSLILLTNPIFKLLDKIFPAKIAKYLAPYLSAYLGSLPITITAFGYASAFAMLFNMIIIPIISVGFVLNILACIALLISPYISIFCLLPELIFTLLIRFITTINYMAFVFENLTFGISIIFYYLVLVSLIEEINFQDRTRSKLFRFLTFMFILSFIVINIRN